MLRHLRYPEHLPPPSRKASGGGVDVLGRTGDASHFLVARGEGTLFRLTWRGDSLSVAPLEPPVPMNASAFDAAADPAVERRWFRVTDVLVAARGDSAEIFVVHHQWRERERCSVLRLSGLRTPAADLAAARGLAGEWRTIYETEPCLPIPANSADPFTGQRAGGRLARTGDGRLLMTVGSHQSARLRPHRLHAQEPGDDYGKTLLVDPASGEARVFTSGHRNPQGLFVDEARGTVWLTEHGPKGGDELNRLVEGANYGWPYRTHGVEYGALTWPLEGERRLPDATEPVHAWLPSIGISSLLVARDSAFARWRGDLLIASLKDEAVWRTRVEGGRVVFAERIPVGVRVRDLVEGPDGSLVLWSDEGFPVRLRPAEAREEGAALHRRYCAPCHLSGANDRATVGPSLEGVVERKIASLAAFDYSAALAGRGGRWNEERLHAFLADPSAFAPGTTMELEGIDDREVRAKIIAYLHMLD